MMRAGLARRFLALRCPVRYAGAAQRKLIESYKRAFVRLPLFIQYNRRGVFPPSMAFVWRFALFAKLQRPTRTDMDAIEFLHGAQQAIDMSLHTMFSKEVVSFAFGRITTSPATQTLRDVLSPMCLDMHLQGLKSLKSLVLSMEMNELAVHSIHVADVTLERLTLAEIKRQEQNDLHNIQIGLAVSYFMNARSAKPLPMPTKLQGVNDIKSIVIEEQDYTTTVERLRLNVAIEMTESVTTAYFKRPQALPVTSDKIAIWVFESIVSTPGDVNWRVVSFVEGEPGQKLVMPAKSLYYEL